jgi:heme-degrading monooxygenase HmoA
MTVNKAQFSPVDRSAGSGDPRSIPPEFGTKPIPAGMVRINHYTDEPAIEGIQAHGLLRSHSEEKFKHGGTESPQVFATAGAPSRDLLHSRPVVEAYANPARGAGMDIGENWADRPGHAEHLEGNRSVVTFHGDLPRENILAVHEPWHAHARYIAEEQFKGRATKPGEDPYATGSLRSQVARGELDKIGEDMRDYGPAIRATKVTNAATVMLGGKL